MALIKCPECGKQISDKAGSCPNCGWKVQLNSKQRKSVSDTQINKKEDNLIPPSRDKKSFFASPKGIILIVIVSIVLVGVAYLFCTVIPEQKYYSYRVEYTSEEEMLDDLCGKWIQCSKEDMYVLMNNHYNVFSDDYTYRAIGWDGFDETYEYTLLYETSEIVHKAGDGTYYADIIEIDGEKYIRSEGLDRGFAPKMKSWMLHKKDID